MNTVFKFYIQVWLLFGTGGAVAIYYMLFGLRERSAGQGKSVGEAKRVDAGDSEAVDAFATKPLVATEVIDEHASNGSENGPAVIEVLFGVKSNDPLVFVIVTAALSVVSLVAVWLPAQRATRIDPMLALRYE
jgi:ABC-type antimicrobial peptide transport system permease subunit